MLRLSDVDVQKAAWRFRAAWSRRSMLRLYHLVGRLYN